MPQMDQYYIDMFNSFFEKEEGWFISSFSDKKFIKLVYNIPNSLVCFLFTTKREECRYWLDIQMISQEHIRKNIDKDVFCEIFTCNGSLIDNFLNKYTELEKYDNSSDYGSIKNIFVNLYDSFLRYIKQ